MAKKRGFLTMLLALVMAIGLTVPAWAGQVEVPGDSGTYTVTYEDGRGGTFFKNEVHGNLKSGEKTPVYNNGAAPTNERYIFKGWLPEVAETVTDDVTYTAQWEAKNESLIKTQLGKIKVECIDNAEGHITKEYGTSVGGYSAVTMQKDREGNYICTITIEAKKYVDRFNEETGKTHQLAVGEAEVRTIVIECDKDYENERVTSGTLPVTFKVTEFQSAPRYYYNSTAAATTTDAPQGSPKTFDAGMGIYALSGLLSLGGLTAVVRKRSR